MSRFPGKSTVEIVQKTENATAYFEIVTQSSQVSTRISFRILVACFPRLLTVRLYVFPSLSPMTFSGYMFSCAQHWFSVFPRLSSDYMFFRAWHQLNVLPRFSPVHVLPRSVLVTFFCSVWHRVTCFSAFVTGLYVFPRLSPDDIFFRAAQFSYRFSPGFCH